jgi:archaemetzincin
MDLRVVFVPVGKMDAAEVEATAGRVAKVLSTAIEVREPVPVPKAGDDPTRGQHLSTPMLSALRAALPRLKVVKLAGAAPAAAPAAPAPAVDVAVFFTDVDLFKPNTDGVFGDIDAPAKAALLSIRRLREAFYKRKADPAKQRARLVKLSLYAIGRLRGLSDCRERACAMTAIGSLADIDMKPEKYCAACWRYLSTGAFRI